MGELKQIALKGLLLGVLLIGLNLAYRQWQLPADLKEHSEAGHMLWQVRDSAEILYLGESSNITIADQDIDKRPISGFLAEYFPGMKVMALSKGALHAGNYLDLLRNIPRSSPLKTVVVTLNLRSFGQAWIYSKLEPALQKEMRLLRPGPALWNRLMLSFREYEQATDSQMLDLQTELRHAPSLEWEDDFPCKSVDEWDKAINSRNLPLANGGTSQPEVELACHYVKAFAFQIQEDNPRIQDFDAIVELAKSRGWNLVLNLLPENVERANELVGSRLADLMEANHQFLLKRYANSANIQLVDNYNLLANPVFIDQHWTTEHYTEPGRRKVAANVAEAIRSWHPEAYQEVKLQANAKAHTFFNDCEGGLIWSQMKTLDKTRAHSGSQSTKLGKGAKFGLTWTYPVPELDSTLLDSLHFEAWVYLEHVAEKASVAMEIGGENITYQWSFWGIPKSQIEVGKWFPISFTVPLWPNTAQADIIKVYPFSSLEEEVWFDDLRIEFRGRR